MQEAWERSTSIRGDATFIEALGAAPELFQWYREFYERVFYGGRVARPLKELLRLRLSMVHGCRYCNLGNRRDAAAGGLSDSKIAAISDPDSSEFSDQERAVLRLADQMCLQNATGQLTPELHATLRKDFDEGEVIELGMTMAVLVGMARFLFVFDLVERDPVCEIPASAANAT